MLTIELGCDRSQQVATENGKRICMSARNKIVVLRHNFELKVEYWSRQNPLCRDTNFCNMEKFVERKYVGEEV